MKSLAPHKVAAQEAWEEAGVCGKVQRKTMGFYGYRKRLPRGKSVDCTVQVFALEVSATKSNYPESGQRKLRWFGPRSAAKRVDEPGLARMIRALPDQLASAAEDRADAL